MNEKWELNTKEEFVADLYDDYTSETFDISAYSADYDRIGEEERSPSGGNADDAETPPFFQADERKNEWEFDGMEMEKHSRRSHAGMKRHKKDETGSETEWTAIESGDEEPAVDGSDPQDVKAETDEDNIAALEEARRIEAEQAAAFERVSRTVQAPIAAMVLGYSPRPEAEPDAEPGPEPEPEDVTWLGEEKYPDTDDMEDIESEFEEMFRSILIGKAEPEAVGQESEPAADAVTSDEKESGETASGQDVQSGEMSRAEKRRARRQNRKGGDKADGD